MLKGTRRGALKLAKRTSSFDGKIPLKALLQADEEIKSDVNKFLTLKKMDSENEKFPAKAYENIDDKHKEGGGGGLLGQTQKKKKGKRMTVFSLRASAEGSPVRSIRSTIDTSPKRPPDAKMAPK